MSVWVFPSQFGTLLAVVQVLRGLPVAERGQAPGALQIRQPLAAVPGQIGCRRCRRSLLLDFGSAPHDGFRGILVPPGGDPMSDVDPADGNQISGVSPCSLLTSQVGSVRVGGAWPGAFKSLSHRSAFTVCGLTCLYNCRFN